MHRSIWNENHQSSRRRVKGGVKSLAIKCWWVHVGIDWVRLLFVSFAVFTTKHALSVKTNLRKHFVVRLVMRL